MFLITLIMTKKEISNLRKEVNKIKLTKEQIASNKARNFIMKLIAKLNGDWVPTPENYGWYIYSKYLYWNGASAGLGSAHTDVAPSTTNAYVGSRFTCKDRETAQFIIDNFEKDLLLMFNVSK